MAGSSNIEWTDATWNPIVGCSIVSPGCTNCYAMKMAARIEKMSEALYDAGKITPPAHYNGTTKIANGNAVWTGEVRMAPDHVIEAPLRWRKRRKIFVNSMGDLFHEGIDDWEIALVFGVMTCATQHTYQVLTKRSARMQALLSSGAFWDQVNAYSSDYAFEFSEADNRSTDDYRAISDDHDPQSPPSNIWLGVSAERQQEADERIPHLLNTPAAVRFVSAEPLLGPVDLDLPLNGWTPEGDPVTRVDWIIVGGESGPQARPMHPQWARTIRDQCAAAGAPFFFKQWGEYLPWCQFTAAAVDDDPEQTRFDTMEWCSDRWVDVMRPMWCDTADGHIDDEQCVGRVGKKRAGRLLDGKEHNAFPNPQPVASSQTPVMPGRLDGGKRDAAAVPSSET